MSQVQTRNHAHDLYRRRGRRSISPAPCAPYIHPHFCFGRGDVACGWVGGGCGAWRDRCHTHGDIPHTWRVFWCTISMFVVTLVTDMATHARNAWHCNTLNTLHKLGCMWQVVAPPLDIVCQYTRLNGRPVNDTGRGDAAHDPQVCQHNAWQHMKENDNDEHEHEHTCTDQR